MFLIDDVKLRSLWAVHPQGEKIYVKALGGKSDCTKEKKERGEEEKEREGRKEEMEREMESIRKSSHLVGRPCAIFFHTKVYVKQDYIISN